MTKPQQDTAHLKPHTGPVSYEASSTERLDRALAPTRTRHPRRERLDRIPSRTTKHLDRTPTRTKARPPTGKAPARMTPGQSARPTHFTYPRTKVRAFNAITCSHLPAWPQPGSTWEQRRCQPSLFYCPSHDGR
jgi:hypothetical protein